MHHAGFCAPRPRMPFAAMNRPISKPSANFRLLGPVFWAFWPSREPLCRGRPLPNSSASLHPSCYNQADRAIGCGAGSRGRAEVRSISYPGASPSSNRLLLQQALGGDPKGGRGCSRGDGTVSEGRRQDEAVRNSWPRAET
jgi:hypothetical protein